MVQPFVGFLSISRSGKSSGELSSVMIRNPMVGNRFGYGIDLENITNMSHKLYVGNLSFDTTENYLQDAFGAHGAVLETNLVMDRETGRARGFAFVTMSTSEEAQKAITALNGVSVGGRALTVNIARPREERGGGANGFGGGRREYSSGGRSRY